MSQEYYGNNGEQFDINVAGNFFLEKITLCLWDKVGIPRPLSKDDALLISRILKNYATLQRNTTGDSGVDAYFWSRYCFAQDDDEELEWIDTVVKFFERCNGLMTEQEWYDKYESGA